jgi:hypothetical protein
MCLGLPFLDGTPDGPKWRRWYCFWNVVPPSGQPGMTAEPWCGTPDDLNFGVEENPVRSSPNPGHFAGPKQRYYLNARFTGTNALRR